MRGWRSAGSLAGKIESMTSTSQDKRYAGPFFFKKEDKSQHNIIDNGY